MRIQVGKFRRAGAYVLEMDHDAWSNLSKAHRPFDLSGFLLLSILRTVPKGYVTLYFMVLWASE